MADSINTAACCACKPGDAAADHFVPRNLSAAPSPCDACAPCESCAPGDASSSCDASWSCEASSSSDCSLRTPSTRDRSPVDHRPRGPIWSAASPILFEGLDADDLVALLDALEDVGGICEIGDLVSAMGDCARPISTILALVDAGLLLIDSSAPFDAHVRVMIAR